MNEIQVKVPRDTIKRAASNVSNFDCIHRTAALIKMEDGNWTHNICCNAGHRQCNCSCECGERRRENTNEYDPFKDVGELVYAFFNLSYFRQDYILSAIGAAMFLTNSNRATEIERIMNSIEENNKLAEFCKMVHDETESYKAGK